MLHPRDKARRYAAELKSRTGPDGKPLSNNQISFRIGYLRARQDAGSAYRSYLKEQGFRSRFPTKWNAASTFRTFDPEQAFRANLERYHNKQKN